MGREEQFYFLGPQGISDNLKGYRDVLQTQIIQNHLKQICVLIRF